jgi:hypothetical protein
VKAYCNFPWKERGFTKAEQSSWPLGGTTLKCNKSQEKHIRDFMPETGVWAQIAPNSSKASYYGEITGGQQYSLTYVPILGSSDGQS